LVKVIKLLEDTTQHESLKAFFSDLYQLKTTIGIRKPIISMANMTLT
ncbi:6559_t:CDS:1, partial [Scutellospora calospora]